MKKLLISSCLLGNNVKYNGKNNSLDLAYLEKLKDKYELFVICPEVMGGLSIPRIPSEIKNNKVISKTNVDVTSNFVSGASQALKIALDNDIKIALLKESSPSCGVHSIYDGNFNGTKINGHGVTTKLLKENGIVVYSEKEIEKLL